jgi:O-antigen ligase
MPRLSALFAGALIAVMSMPQSINLLGLAGGELIISLAPLLLTCGFLFGLKASLQQFGQFHQILGTTNRYLLVFILLATVSVVWSEFALVTTYRLYRLYALFFVCIYFSINSWDPHKFSSTLQGALLFLTFSSIIFFFLSPIDAVQESLIAGHVYPELVDAWRGVTLHKNTLGAVASTAVIICFHTLYTRSGSRFFASIGLICGLICLIKARSSTSLFAAFFAIALIALILKSPSIEKRRTIRVYSFILVVFFLIYSLGVLNIVPGLAAIVEPLVALTGKDMTFSGRTVIWGIMKDEISKHPFLGIGYAAFWLGNDPLSPSAIFKIRMYIDPGEAHNGYLDVINELGFIGAIALIGYLFTFIRQAVQLMAFDRKKPALFIALLFAELIANMSEAHWWNLANVNFLIMTLATFDLSRSLLDARRRKINSNARHTTQSDTIRPGLSPGDRLNVRTIAPQRKTQ